MSDELIVRIGWIVFWGALVFYAVVILLALPIW